MKRIAVLGFDGVEALDLLCPLETFSAVRSVGPPETRNTYQTMIVGCTRKPFVSESGVVFVPHTTLDDAPQLDTIVVPGGAGLRLPHTCSLIATWLRSRDRRTRRIASVCTGIYGLASSGLLDGRRASTHWNFARDVSEKFPKVTIEANSLFVRDGRYYTSAGITAGIDLALSLIEEDVGSRIASAVARYLVVYVKRCGGQDQYSEPLQYQSRTPERFSDLLAWVLSDLQRDMPLNVLAAKVNMSPRHFSRLFTEAFSVSPADFVEEMRLNEARGRLVVGRIPIGRIARAVGYASADAFRRAFQRRFGISPTNYRDRFPTSHAK